MYFLSLRLHDYLIMTHQRLFSCLAFALLLTPYAVCQDPTLPSSFPHDYPGKPSGDFSPVWQKCARLHELCLLIRQLKSRLLFPDFQVTSPLPNITFDIGTTYAGNIPVQRAGHPNNTLFFVGVEKTKGSLIAKSTPANRDPWGIWLNGG